MANIWTDASLMLAGTQWATALRESVWVFPIIEVLHVVGVALLIGPILVVDRGHARAGAGDQWRPVQRLALPLAWAGFAIAAASGIALFGAQADKIAANTWLQAKLALIGAAGVNMAWFHARQRTGQPLWLPAALSLLLWSLVLVLARLIAYAE